MKKILLFLALSLLSSVFAQEGPIRIKIPLDSTGMLIATPNRSEMPVQKLGLSSNRQLNLAELSARDTASFETYSRRLAIVQDSINVMQKEIDNSKKRTTAQMPSLEPKGEYEKQSEFEERKAKRERELGERMIRDYKPYSERLTELEKAKKKIEDNRAALYCTLEINTNLAASIFLNNEEIGSSPAKYDRVVPGNTVIKLIKDKYEPWDTTLILQPAQKLKLNVTLYEKSIFSKEGELNFQQIIARDTTVQGYRARMGSVRTRMSQVDVEIKNLLENFGKIYPP
ncbi:MAG: PEGA domain-containing protein, partial [Fibromonadales bacterium]|nr:PEGA domain-containing protein [Fibromonadales bacterium]